MFKMLSGARTRGPNPSSSRSRRVAVSVAAVGAMTATMLVTAPSASAVTVPAGFAATTVANGITNAVGMEFMPDGRLLVMQQDGTIRLIKNSSLVTTPLGVVPGVYFSGHAGMLGIAFDPQFATNRWMYAAFTTQIGGFHVRVSRFTVDGDILDPASQQVLLDLEPLVDGSGQPSEFHYGADLEFKQDGMLYVSLGEGFVSSRSQSMSTTFGKVLRISPNGSIPTDNPFYNTTTGLNRAIYALGVRNPWKMVHDPVTDTLLLSDVGASSWEELDVVTRAANYGWPTAEGMSSNPAFTNPVHTWPHAGGEFSGCAAAGADFYQPNTVSYPSSYLGKVFFTDHCGGWVRVLDLSTGASTPFLGGFSKMLDVKVESIDGTCLVSGPPERRGGSRFLCRHAVPRYPDAARVADGQHRDGNQTFSVNAFGGTPPLSFQWLRNGASIPGATGNSLTLPAVTAADNGAKYRVIVRDSVGGSVTSAIAHSHSRVGRFARDFDLGARG